VDGCASCLLTKAAVTNLKRPIGCQQGDFAWDGDKTLSMFARRMKACPRKCTGPKLKKSATAVIGRNHKDGNWRIFCAERVSL